MSTEKIQNGPPTEESTSRQKVAPQTASANSVIAAIDARRPGMKLAKKHLLMFFAQGHHIAHFGRTLFNEPITAHYAGVSVPDADGGPAEQPDSEGVLNTIGYVIERYGSLSPADLRTLIQSSQPWEEVAPPYGDGVIAPMTLHDWFRRDDETNDPDDERPNRAERAQVEGLWKTHKAQQVPTRSTNRKSRNPLGRLTLDVIFTLVVAAFAIPLLMYAYGRFVAPLWHWGMSWL